MLVTFVVTILLGGAPGQSVAKPMLVETLGCGNCHLGVRPFDFQATGVPTLVRMGQQFRPGYVEHLLLKSTPNGHMAVFSMSPSEMRGTIAAIFNKQTSIDDPWPVLDTNTTTSARRGAFEQLDCLTCHQETGKSTAPFSAFKRRYRFAYIQKRLSDLRGDDSNCKTSTKSLTDVQISGVIKALSPNVAEEGVDWETATPKVNWLTASQCGQCHGASGERILDLKAISKRVRSDWLVNYLQKTTPIRPAGVWPGDGYRMPNYQLSDAQARQVTKELRRLSGRRKTLRRFKPLTRSRSKAVKRLLAERYSCQGCHKVEGQGGTMGPTLDGVAQRLPVESIRTVIRGEDPSNPQSSAAHGSMGPHPAATDDLIRELASWSEPMPVTTYVPYSKLKPRARPGADEKVGPRLYGQYCSGCHGPSGRGDGFNATSLNVAPMVHRRQVLLSASTDERLHMALSGGGWMLGKSRLMPGFRGALSNSEISELVQHLRVLCQCEIPTWSKDGAL